MPTHTQQNRPVKVYTALADDVLLFGSMSGTERLSEPFEYELVLVSESDDIDPADLLGTDLTIELELPAGGVRHVHGYVADFADAPGDGGEAELAAYTLSVRPWLWFLSRTADCRIFQEMSVPDIIQEVIADAGFDDIDIELTESFAPWTYCVQYRETDLAFVSRLMEQEGIHYYFRHERGRHRLVLADGGSGHETLADYADVPLFPPDTMDHRERDHLVRWRVGRNLRPGRYALGDFNFETPSASLRAEKLTAIVHAHAGFEVYDYPGEHADKVEGEARAKVLLEASEARHEIAHGAGPARGLLAGNRFSLTGSPRGRDNREYLVVASACTFSLENFRSGGEGGLVFECRIEATGSDRPWRPVRRTPKPHVRGPQTAIVVGPSGEEIWTDKHGRVKLQFHWDRYGVSDENSSCWVRVSQLWAGKGWGAMHVPRIGHEVIVEFLEGDPDRPIVTGRVYNGENPVPHPLPASATQSGIKSRSTKGGAAANFNEIRMEDAKGSEQLYVHAEKNQDNVVENDETTAVGHDRSENVGHDETIEIGRDRRESVGRDETIAVGRNRDERVGSDESVSVGRNRNADVGDDESVSVGSNRAETIGKNQTVTVGGARALSVSKRVAESSGDGWKQDVGGDHVVSVGKGQSITVSDDGSLSVGKDLKIVAGDSIEITTGRASIRMSRDGTIVIRGKDVTVQGSGAVNVKASKNVVVKGKKVVQN